MNPQFSPPVATAPVDLVTRATANMILPAARATHIDSGASDASVRLQLDNDRLRNAAYFDDVLSALQPHLRDVVEVLNGRIQVPLTVHEWRWAPTRKNVEVAALTECSVLDEYFFVAIAVGITFLRRALAIVSQRADAATVSIGRAEAVFGGVVLRTRHVNGQRAAAADSLRCHAYSLRCQLFFNTHLKGVALMRANGALLAAHAARLARHHWTRFSGGSRESQWLFDACVSTMTKRALRAIGQLTELPRDVANAFEVLSRGQPIKIPCVAVLIDSAKTASIGAHRLVHEAKASDNDDNEEDAEESGEPDGEQPPTPVDGGSDDALGGCQMVFVHLADANLALSRPEFAPSSLVSVAQNKKRRQWCVVGPSIQENNSGGNIAIVLPLGHGVPIEQQPCLKRWPN